MIVAGKTYGESDGKLSIFQEALACFTLGLLLAWYYLVTILSISLLCLIIFAPTYRKYATAALVLFWSMAYWPVDHSPWGTFCNSWLFRLWRNYFYYEYIVEEEFTDPKKRYLFAELPHGIFPFGQFISISIIGDILPGSTVKSIAASVLFRLPGLRHVFSWIGCRPASPANIAAIFAEGGNCAITVGGLAEMFLVGGEKERLYLRKHRGFVREAIKHGADLVPAFCFGNSTLLSVVGQQSEVSMGLLKRISRKLQASLLIFYGRWGLPVPFRRPLKFVIGKPIQVKQNPTPTDEEIRATHQLFMDQLEVLYEKHKPEWEKRPLSIE